MSHPNIVDIGGSVSSEEDYIFEASPNSPGEAIDNDASPSHKRSSKGKRSMGRKTSKMFSSIRKRNDSFRPTGGIGSLSRNSSKYDSSSNSDDDNDHDNYADLFDTVDEYIGEVQVNPPRCTASSVPSSPSSMASMAAPTAPPAINAQDRALREAKKERVKEKLDKYKKERTLLRHSCRALEQQLVQTTEKLREVDIKAAKKIDSLESELTEARSMMEAMVNKSGKEATDQTMCIKTLGKKLIRQAHVIKQQKRAVDEYEIQLDALREEMAMQEERDSIMEEDFVSLRNDYESLKKQKEATQRSLQENIEEMMDLQQERDQAAARIKELEMTLEEKEQDLTRVQRESSEKSERITTLETELIAKIDQIDTISLQLKASEQATDIMKSELERTTDEIEELRNKVADLDQASRVRQRPAFLGWRSNRLPEGDEEGDTLEDQLLQRDMKIQALDRTVKTNEETITSLKSDMVKMSSSYKQDDYLKRKQIAKLKQINQHYAKKLKALESSFKHISEDVSLHGYSTHGGSMHGSSIHSVKAMTKEGMMEEVKKRLGESGSEGSQELRKGEMPEEC